ncbi:hypothetical protein GOP47_0015207 [Adiantum capillus-veneris]|uniref:Uncharacterized protein n=1 Tax=Adiantum capillus-veneris TaxID=13818 RepID=A0A9D4UMY1_ADICA|nr:hypothetical protein GOP47_0015207 [Adiantum capillus-veneris]
MGLAIDIPCLALWNSVAAPLRISARHADGALLLLSSLSKTVPPLSSAALPSGPLVRPSNPFPHAVGSPPSITPSPGRLLLLEGASKPVAVGGPPPVWCHLLPSSIGRHPCDMATPLQPLTHLCLL